MQWFVEELSYASLRSDMKIDLPYQLFSGPGYFSAFCLERKEWSSDERPAFWCDRHGRAGEGTGSVLVKSVMDAETHRPTWKILLAFAIIYFVWGSTFLAIRVGVREVPPFLLAAMRFSVAGLVVYGWMIAGASAHRAGANGCQHSYSLC